MLKNLLLLSVFSFFVAIVIIVANIYLSQNTSTITPSVKKSISPINPTFNTKIINDLKKRSLIMVSLQDKTRIINKTVNNSVVITSSGSAEQPKTISPTRATLP